MKLNCTAEPQTPNAQLLRWPLTSLKVGALVDHLLKSWMNPTAAPGSSAWLLPPTGMSSWPCRQKASTLSVALPPGKATVLSMTAESRIDATLSSASPVDVKGGLILCCHTELNVRYTYSIRILCTIYQWCVKTRILTAFLYFFRECPGPLSTKDCFLFRFLTLQFTLFTLLKNDQVNFIVQISKFPSPSRKFVLPKDWTGDLETYSTALWLLGYSNWWLCPKFSNLWLMFVSLRDIYNFYIEFVYHQGLLSREYNFCLHYTLLSRTVSA